MKKTNIETRNNGYMITRSLEDSSRHVEGYAVVGGYGSKSGRL